MTSDAEQRVTAYLDASDRYGRTRPDLIDTAAAGGGTRARLTAPDLRDVLQALADMRTENERMLVEAATEKSRRELFQDALAEVQAERDRLRTEFADSRQQLDQARDDADFTQALADMDHLTRERDEARDMARTLTRHNGVVATAALCRLKLGVDPLPDWVFAGRCESPADSPEPSDKEN